MDLRNLLSYDQTVNRRLAHRRALGEVFVSDSLEASPDDFLVSVQIPRAHSLWNDRTPGFHEPLAMVEAGRQATFVVAHRHLLVPQGPTFIMQDVDFRVVDLDAFRDDRPEPFEGIFRFKLLSRSDTAGGLTAMSFKAELLVGSLEAMILQGSVTFLAPADYEVLRAFGRAGKAFGYQPRMAPIDPALRSRTALGNVVIGNRGAGQDAEAAYPVIVDESHPSYYDHPLDHAPGSLLLEAARQAAIAEAVRTSVLPSPTAALTACKGRFDRFAEPDAALECWATVPVASFPSPVTAAVEFRQLGQRVALLDLELSPLDR